MKESLRTCLMCSMVTFCVISEASARELLSGEKYRDVSAFNSRRLEPGFTAAAFLPQVHSKEDDALSRWSESATNNVSAWQQNLMMATIKGGDRRAYHLFDAMLPNIGCPPPDETPTRFGHNDSIDGYKFLCRTQLQSTCLVLSIGSKLDTQFEESILRDTACTVVTLDCTMKVALEVLGPRHTFYPLCLGDEAKAAKDKRFVTLAQLTKKLGVKTIDVLKMDIEGYEWDVIPSLRSFGNSVLPRQIAMEIHIKGKSLEKVHMFAMHLATLGYGIVSRDDNEQMVHGTELVLHQVDLPTARWDRLENKKTVVAAIVALLGGTWIVNSVLGSVDNLPLFSRAFKFVGLIVSGNFTWQYLVLDEGRQELKSIIKEKYAGFRDLVEDFPGGGATASVYDEEDTTITSRPPITDPLVGGPRSVLGVPPIPETSGAGDTPFQE